MGQLVLGFLAVTDNSVASFAMIGELRLRTLDHLRELPMGFHIGRQQGDTASAYRLSAPVGNAYGGAATAMRRRPDRRSARTIRP